MVDSKPAPSRPVQLGIALLLAVLVMCVPTTVPRFFGYEVYEVMSESMQPHILAGSAIFTKQIEPDNIVEMDVIAFMAGEDVVVRRVALNRPSIGEFVTRADANSIDDPRPVDYDAVIGKVYLSIPVLGRIMSLYTSDRGRWVLTGVVVLGTLLVVFGPRLSAWARARRKARREAGKVRLTMRIVAALLVLVALGMGGAAAFVWYDLGQDTRGIEEASKRFTRQHTVPGELAPVVVDFSSLSSLNGDIVGWLYCEGTPVSFPVLYSENSLYYQLHSYDGSWGVGGSVWMESTNSPSFGDARTLLYGQGEVDDFLFAHLAAWEDQAYASEHSTMWLLTPRQDYRVDLVAVCREVPTSVVFEYVPDGGGRLEALVARTVANSSVSFDVAEGPVEGPYLSLATHSLLSSDQRIVLTGKMTPVDSAGGAAL